MTDNMIKVALIVMVLFFLLFGGLGFYYMSQVGSEQKEGSFEKQLAEQKAQREQLLEDIAKLAIDIKEEESKLAELKEQKEAVTDHVKRLRVARDSFNNHAEIRKSHSENIQATERRVSSALEGSGEANAPTIQSLRTKKEEFEEGYTKRRDELQNTSDDITKELTKQTS